MKKEFTTNICLKCSTKKQNSCCNYPVPLTIADIEKIKLLGYKLEDFVTYKEYEIKEHKNYTHWFKKSLIKIGDKYYKIIIKKNNNGLCVYLKKGKGCTLNNNRPSICKLFPFWVWKGGNVIFDEYEKGSCIAVNHSINEILCDFQENKDKIKEYFYAFKEDCIKNKKQHIELLKKLLKK